jgi:hypothetical protein
MAYLVKSNRWKNNNLRKKLSFKLLNKSLRQLSIRKTIKHKLKYRKSLLKQYLTSEDKYVENLGFGTLQRSVSIKITHKSCTKSTKTLLIN